MNKSLSLQKPPKPPLLHSDYLQNILDFLNKKDALSLKKASTQLYNEVGEILNKTHYPKTLPQKIRLKNTIELKNCNIQKEAEEGFPSTQPLVNDDGQWDAKFIIHCLEKTKPTESYLENKKKILFYAAELGDMTLLNLLKKETLINDARANNNYALRWAARNGHVDVLRFLKDNFDLTDEDARTWNNYALRMAAYNGHLVVLCFLKNDFGLTADDARADDKDALRLAAEYGHVEVLRVLNNEFGLTADDARADNNWALKKAAGNGHV